MQVKLFFVGIAEFEQGNEELNKFLRSKKVVTVDSNFISHEKYCGWAFTVQYLEGVQNNFTALPKEKIDYKNVLDESTFEIFSKLREIRKQLAEEDAVPAYAVFTNEELAEIAKLEELTEKNMLKIQGIGEKKVEKYGKKMIEIFRI
ncbi:MAG: HRDC domain-containing protein [Bacteroidales bacterium]|jgi:superfamily II DNA helicase RecQ|nr:HRDC domain-containing protein [Bacteroidales bacterium]